MKYSPPNRPQRWLGFLDLCPTRLTALALLAGSLAAGCSDSPDESSDVLPPKGAQEVHLNLQTLRPEIRKIRESIVGTGSIGAAQTSDIGVVLPGIVERVYVKVGDKVEKGQPLFQTRRTDYEIGVQLARAEMTAAEARAKQARLEYERAEELLGKNFISQAQLDTAENARGAADAETGISKARLAQAEQRLTDTVVRAPYDGVVTRRNVDEGTYKSAQSFSADGSVLQLQDIHVVVAVVHVPEVYIKKISVGMPADLFIDGMADVFPSEIWVINDKVDQRARTLEVRFAMTNEDYRVKPGLFVRAEIRPPGRTAMLLDQRAILDRADSPHVFLLEGGKARRQSIVLREYDGTYVEIVSGLAPDASIIVGPDLVRLVDGDPIRGSINVDR